MAISGSMLILRGLCGYTDIKIMLIIAKYLIMILHSENVPGLVLYMLIIMSHKRCDILINSQAL